MDVELQATCSALGYMEGNEYVKEPDCHETVKDLIRFLRRDTDICDIRRQLGHAQIVENDLIPLVKFYHKDKGLFDTVMKLLVNLTQSVATCYNNEIPDEKTLRNYCIELEGYLQDTKEAFINEDLFCVLAEKIQDILKLEWDERREEDKLHLERLFVLIRNILLIPPDPDREQRTEDDASTHDQILWMMHTSGVEDLILYVASSDRERSMLCMHVMEIVSLMFREQEAETLASAGVQRSITEKEKDQKELEHAREKERSQKKANVLKFSARHSRFGGTFVIKDMKSISEKDVVYHKPLCEVKTFSYDDGKVPKKKAKNRAPIKGDDPKRRSTLSMRLSLKEFCVQFLINAYNPLMRAVKDALTRKTTQDNDETFYLWAMRFFMEFCRLHCKRVDLVSETMSMPSFHYIYTQLCTYYENVTLGKGEECKAWGRRSHLALKAYQELLRTLDSMSRSRDKQIQESAKVIQSNVFYMIEYRDIFITLLKNFKESKCSRAYLRDLVESTHIFLKMLEVFTKSSKHIVVQKKKTKKKKKKMSSHAEGLGAGEPTEEELEAVWDQDISGELSALLQGRQAIPDDVTPFDAASEVDMEEQRINTMIRIQDCLRQKKAGEGLGLFRAAREVWPEREEFGSEGMGEEEEFTALREIFMASLPRPEAQQEENAEEDVNEVEEEEREEVRTCETEFDFKNFINDFAHQNVVKSYAILLSEFKANSDTVNHCVVKMLHRLSHDLGYVGMLFQASVFRSFSSILHGPYSGLSRYKELSKFACYVVRQFTAIAKVNKKIFVDLLFWKTRNEALAITSDYDFAPKSKSKALWTEHEEQELSSLYERFRDVSHPELDTVDLILGELTSNHTRLQVLKELKHQGLITSAKDIKKGGRSIKWIEEDIEELRAAFDQHKNSDYPISDIMKSINSEKSKRSVIAKILELGLVDDKKQLLKQRRGGRQRRRRGGSESDEDRRLFSAESGGGGQSGSDSDSEDDDYQEGDEDDGDENIRLLVRQAASTVGDYVNRLIENGFKEQLAWIQRGLRNTAEDRTEGLCVPTPIVPLTDENETAMDDDIFLIFLRSIGITPPATSQEMFWRIPAEFSSSDLEKIADGLDITESGEACNAEEIQQIVSKVFPNLTTSGLSSSSQNNRNEQKKEKRSIKKKRKEKDGGKQKIRKKTESKAKKKNFKGNLLEDNEESEDNQHFSSSDDDPENEKISMFVPRIARKAKDSDTSDSGLDEEIEAREQEKIWKEKQDSKRMGGSKKDRKKALEKMMNKRKDKPGRKDRAKRSESSPPPSGTSIPEADKSDDILGFDIAKRKLTESSPTSATKKKKLTSSRIKTLESDSDCDTSSLSSLSGNEKDEKINQKTQSKSENKIARSQKVDGISKKRMLESDSNSDQNSEKRGHKNPADGLQTKRTKFLSSDEESIDEDNFDDVVRTSKEKKDSDKENANKGESDSDKNTQSQHDESLRLHFSSSEDEDGNVSETLNTTGKSSQMSLNDTPVKGSASSFPATLLTQSLDSSDEDDHIPLSTAMKRKRAVVEDDDEDE